MKQMQSYATAEDEFFPLFLAQDWQVDMLNCFDGIHIDAIGRVEVYHNTDVVYHHLSRASQKKCRI